MVVFETENNMLPIRRCEGFSVVVFLTYSHRNLHESIDRILAVNTVTVYLLPASQLFPGVGSLFCAVVHRNSVSESVTKKIRPGTLLLDPSAS